MVVNRRTMEVLAGNHTLVAAVALGWTELAATFVDVGDDEAARIVLADNRTSDVAGYDDQALAALLSSLDDLAGTGFGDADLEALLASVTELPEVLEPDAVPPLPKRPVSQVGDVWLLGKHRVACGDSTDAGVLEALMVGGQADCVWTDPPYGVSYQANLSVEEAKRLNRRTDGLVVENDEMTGEALQAFLRDALSLAWACASPGAAWYVAAPSGPQFVDFGVVLGELEVWRQTLVWVKDKFAFGRSDYHYRHESIFYGWKEGAAHHAPPDRTQDTVWEVPRPKRSAEHPTMKPVELITRAVENSTDRGAVVLDPFGGSGSTLIACHMTGRRARLVELDPRYVDVICRRYQEAGGEVPVRESTGRPHDFTEAT